MNLGSLITDNLFGKPDNLTKAHRFYFKIFELYIVYETINLAWEWGLYTLKISDVVLPLGIANIIDISFMHDNYLPFIVIQFF